MTNSEPNSLVLLDGSSKALHLDRRNFGACGKDSLAAGVPHPPGPLHAAVEGLVLQVEEVQRQAVRTAVTGCGRCAAWQAPCRRTPTCPGFESDTGGVLNIMSARHLAPLILRGDNTKLEK